VDEATFRAYADTLKPLEGGAKGAEEGDKDEQEFEIDTGSECATGACPIR